MTFYEVGTNVAKYNYIHTLNNRGLPDTLILNPDKIYDLMVHTIPPLGKKNISIIRSQHNIIKLDAPQGFLKLDLDDAINKYYPTTIVRKNGEMQTLNAQEFGKTEKYIVGKYDLEILTLPRIYLKNVEIKQSSTNLIQIPSSASIQFNKPDLGFGSIYCDDGKIVNWVCNFNNAIQNEVIYLQPGKYKVVYRYGFAKETTKTIEQNFEVKSGTPKTIRLF
jgi:Ca-activated chloride channel family protein